jgi:hypothetical protein
MKTNGEDRPTRENQVGEDDAIVVLVSGHETRALGIN